MRHDKALGKVNGMYLKYVPGVILDKGTIGPVSTQKTGLYCSTAGSGMSGLEPRPGDSRAREKQDKYVHA